MKVLVTGATGRVGRALIDVLVRSGHEVRALVRPGSLRAADLEELPVQVFHGDIRSRYAVAYAVSGMDAVYHLAAVIKGTNHREFTETNILGTQNVLDACVQHASTVRRVIFASTDALYDKSGFRREPITEDEPLHANDDYTISKHTSELTCRQYRRWENVPVTIARLPLVIAPGEFLDRKRLPGFFAAEYQKRVESAARRELSPNARQAADKYIAESLLDDPLIVPRTLDGISFKRAVGDARDVANGLALILNEPAAVGETINLSGWPIIWEEFIPYLAERLGKRYVDLRLPIMPTHYEYSREKARYLLGYYPRHDARSMIDAVLGESEVDDSYPPDSAVMLPPPQAGEQPAPARPREEREVLEPLPETDRPEAPRETEQPRQAQLFRDTEDPAGPDEREQEPPPVEEEADREPEGRNGEEDTPPTPPRTPPQ